MIRKASYRISFIISAFFGFTILLLFDMVNPIVSFTPFFRWPTKKGMIVGPISVIIYFFLMIFLKKTYANYERKPAKFILLNILVFIIAFVLFTWVGVVFFIEIPSYG